MTKEAELKPKSLVEKLPWWGKVGGLVAGVIGIIRHSAELLTGGAVVATGSFVAEQILFKRPLKSA